MRLLVKIFMNINEKLENVSYGDLKKGVELKTFLC